MTNRHATCWPRLLFVALIVLSVLSGAPPSNPAHAQDSDPAYQAALDRIQEAQDTDATELNLGKLGLTDLPPEIGQLTALQKFWLDGNILRSLPSELGQLVNLRELYLGDNTLTHLPPELGQLTALQNLALDDNALSSLPPEFGQLTNLQKLWLNDNTLTRLPPELGQLANLQELYLSGNSLESPPPKIVARGTEAVLEYLREQLDTGDNE